MATIKIFIACLFVAGIFSTSNQVEIKGKVVAASDNSAIPAVNVVIKGADVKTTTDSDGNFVLKYDAKASEKIVIKFSFIGFQQKEQEVVLTNSNKNIGTISLKEE